MFTSILKGCGILIVAMAIWVVRSEVGRTEAGGTDDAPLDLLQEGATASIGFAGAHGTAPAAEEPANCRACRRSGRCTLCYGRGKLVSGGDTIDCSRCHGTGVCSLCRGHSARNR